MQKGPSRGSVDSDDSADIVSTTDGEASEGHAQQLDEPRRDATCGQLAPVPGSILPWPVLNAQERHHIVSHKYKPGQYTPLEHLLMPYWNTLTELLPRNLAPNLITFLGFVPLAVAFTLGWFYSPSFSTAVPGWLCLFSAAALYWYQTADYIDGKQARRIGCSTPVGQLFDHGVDCLACVCLHSMAAVVLLPGPGRLALGGLSALMTGFFMAQWQEHYTGVLYTCFGPVGVLESQLGLIALALFGAYAGAEDFMRAPAALGLSTGQVGVVAWLLFMSFLVLLALQNTFTLAPKGGDSVPVAGHVQDSSRRRARALTDLAPVILLNAILLLGFSDAVVARRCRMLGACASVLFFYYTAQMILKSMAHSRFPAVQPTLAPFAAAAAISHAAPAMADLVLVAVTVALFVYVGAWLLTVVAELKASLGIYIFSVRRPAHAAKAA